MTEKDTFPAYPEWETVRRLGGGSYGSVYEIQRDLFGKIEKAALKQISIPQSESDVEELFNTGYDEADISAHYRNYLTEIVKEYQLMTQMKGHTNIVDCDDIRWVQKDDGFGWDVYIRMELLTPMTKVWGQTAGEQQVIKLGKDMCNALVLCRSRNIIHRDIKPANILVSADGDFKLGDFGIAKTAEKTSGGTKIGTYNYMAPEVYNNQPYGHGADIYSLGLVLYWLLNDRRLPFYPAPPEIPDVVDMENARMRRFQGEPLPPPAHGSEYLKKIVLKASAFDPRDRYQTAEDMLRDLQILEAGGIPDAASFSSRLREEEDSLLRTEREETLVPDQTETIRLQQEGSETSRLEKSGKQDQQGPEERRRNALLPWGLLAAAVLLILVMMLLRDRKPDPTAAETVIESAPPSTVGPTSQGEFIPISTLEPGAEAAEILTSDPTPEPSPEPTPEPTTEPTPAPAPVGDSLLRQMDAWVWEADDDYPSSLTRVSFSGAADADSYMVQPYRGSTLYYYPQNVEDDNCGFPWIEDVSGPGIDQSIKLYFNREETISYLSMELGFAPLRDKGEYYFKNNRPSRLRISFSDGSYVICDYNDKRVEWITKFPTVRTEWVKITILDVHYGLDNDTCIYKVRAYR